jgi:Protein of unknown function (DUF2946)
MSKQGGSLMRRRLRKFLPIVLMALMVQIIAPIAACWAAGIAASDPLSAAAICHDNGSSTSGQTDQTGQPRAHEGCCSVCSVAHSGAPIDPAQAAVTTPYPDPVRVVWLDHRPEVFGSRTGSHAQARAPPPLT